MNKNMLKKLLILLIPVSLVAATVGTIIYANKVVGIYSQENFMDNGDFEKNTYGTVLSGGGSTAISISAASGIFGNALQVDTPQANDEIRMGISNRIVALGGLNCEARFNLKLGSTNTVPTVVDVDVLSNAGTLSISNTQRVTLSTSNSWIPMSVNFPCSRPVGATYARIKIITAGTASVGNPYFWVDSVYAGEATNIINQVVVTDEQSYTPVSPQGLGTLSSVDLKYWRVGSKLYVRGTFTTGTVTGSEARLDLPLGLTTKADTITNTIVGKFGRGSAQTAHGGFVLKQNNVNYVLFSAASVFGGTSSNSLSPEVGTNIFTNTEKVSVDFAVEINGWSTTQSSIVQQCIQDGSCENTFSVKSTNGGVTSDEGQNWVNGNAVVSDTSLFTFTLTAGFFGADPKCWADLEADASGASMSANVVSDTSTTVVVRTLSGGAKSAQPFTLYCTRGSTDYKPRFAAPALVGSVTSNATGALRIEGVKLSSTGVVTYETSDWISGNCSSSSPYACTINAGVFSATPVCVATSGVGAAFAAETFTVLTSTAFTIQKIGNNAGATEVICFGLR